MGGHLSELDLSGTVGPGGAGVDLETEDHGDQPGLRCGVASGTLRSMLRAPGWEEGRRYRGAILLWIPVLSQTLPEGWSLNS